MKQKTRELMLPKLRAQAAVLPKTLDVEARTVEVLFYSGASVQRFPWFDDPYELSFSLDKSAVRLGRFNNGAPLVDNHQTLGSVAESVLGVVEKAWLADDGGHALVRFSAREGVDAIFKDVQDRILRNFSIGAVIHQMRDITEKGDAQKRLLAIDWEPHELSLVPVPADADAQALAVAEKFPCQINFSAAAGANAPKEDAMRIKVRLLADVEELGKVGEIVEIDPADFDETLHSKALKAPTGGEDTNVIQLAVAQQIKRDKERAESINRAASHFGLDAAWAQRHISLGTMIEDVLTDASAERAKKAPVILGQVSGGTDYESREWRSDQMALAVASRARRVEVPESAHQYAKASFSELALEVLGWYRRGRGKHARLDAPEIVGLALHSTSDFPLLLLNALNKTLQPAYEQANPSYRRIASPRQFSDFRPHHFAKAGDFPVPLQVQENGEFTYGTMGEAKEIVTAITYGRILGLSRQMLINDDLSAFADLATKAGRRVADFENATFYTICILAAAGLGPTLVEGAVAVFNAAHNNLTGAGALSNTLLGSAWALMQAQTSIDGLKLNIGPSFVLTSPASHVLARTLLTEIQATQASNINPFAGMMTAISDANLTGTRFYVLADPGALPNYVYGFVGGTGPRTEVRNGFNVDGVEFKVALDFACGAIDFRGAVSGAGA